jgi:hypothetical protein
MSRVNSSAVMSVEGPFVDHLFVCFSKYARPLLVAIPTAGRSTQDQT